MISFHKKDGVILQGIPLFILAIVMIVALWPVNTVTRMVPNTVEYPAIAGSVKGPWLHPDTASDSTKSTPSAIGRDVFGDYVGVLAAPSSKEVEQKKPYSEVLAIVVGILATIYSSILAIQVMIKNQLDILLKLRDFKEGKKS